MLTIGALGMFAYGVYSVAWVGIDLLGGRRLELWAEAGVAAFGLLLALSAAFVRVRLPGGLAFAMSALLGLQALAVHNAVHLEVGVPAQVARGVFAGALVALAYLGSRQASRA